MAEITIRPARGFSDRRQFLSLPWQLHRDDPNWIPPLRQHQKEMTGFARHPFWDYAEGCPMIAVRDGKTVGRILPLINSHHNQRHKEKTGFFGFFESIDDQDVANALFDAAATWLAERNMDRMRGPVNPSLNYEIGLLIDGFDTPPTFMMTYNPEYYPKLFDAYGLERTQDLYAYWGHINMIEKLNKKIDFIVTEAKRRFNVQLRRLDTKNFDRDVQSFLRIYNESLVGTWGFNPMSDDEVKHMAKGLKRLIIPEMTTMAEIDGRPVGAAFGMLDYNPRIKQIDGRLFPFGFMKLLGNRRAIHKVRILAANVIPEYQRWGLGLVLLSRLLPDVLAWGIEEGEFSWILESNRLSWGSLESGGAKRVKTYRLYDKPLTSPAIA